MQRGSISTQTDTDEITFRCLLAKAAESNRDTRPLEKTAREMILGLEVYKTFQQHVTGNHKPLQHNTEATGAIANFIAESVAAGSNNAVAKDLHSYFSAMPRQPVDTADLYS